MPELFSPTALAIGFWSSTHCLAMCGGLAMAAGHTARYRGHPSRWQQRVELLFWQLGRVLSYGFMGALAGLMGAFFLQAAPLDWARTTAMVLANLMLIGLGLHLARLSSLIQNLEHMGQFIWRYFAPWAQATLTPQPVEGLLPGPPLGLRLLKALRTGAIWGWLPCGLVYSMLVTASVTGSAGKGLGWMISFGLGTLPALWATSVFSQRLLGRFTQDGVRRAAGLLIIGFGVWGLLRAFNLVTVPWLDAFCVTS
jgi:sulfite exporter TauE/SafE